MGFSTEKRLPRLFAISEDADSRRPPSARGTFPSPPTWTQPQPAQTAARRSRRTPCSRWVRRSALRRGSIRRGNMPVRIAAGMTPLHREIASVLRPSCAGLLHIPGQSGPAHHDALLTKNGFCMGVDDRAEPRPRRNFHGCQLACTMMPLRTDARWHVTGLSSEWTALS